MRHAYFCASICAKIRAAHSNMSDKVGTVPLFYSVREGGTNMCAENSKENSSMRKEIRKSDVKILAANKSEIGAEYVWTNCIDESEGGRYFNLSIDGKKSRVVRMLFADSNFIKNYFEDSRYPERKDLVKEQYIVMSGHYRRVYGGLVTYFDPKGKDNTKHTVVIDRAWFLGFWRASSHFPNICACMSVWLGVVGVIIGLLSLLPCCCKCCGK